MARTKYTYNEKRKEWYTLVYDGTLTPSGAKHRKRISSKKSSADLEKKVIAFKQEVAEKGAVVSSNISFGEYARIWLETSKATKERNTQRMYEGIINSCFNEIYDLPISSITHMHFQICINSKMEHPRTCQQLSLTFKQIIKSAVRDRLLPRTALEDILEDISLPKYQKPQKRALSDLEKEALFNADLSDKERAFVSILYYCGLRKGEVLALSKSDFDWKNNHITISKTWFTYKGTPSIKPYPKSENGVRQVPIPDVAIEHIKPFVDGSGEYVFCRSNGKLIPESSYETMWSHIVKQLSLAAGEPIQKLTAHVFRHNYCTELCYQIPLISTKKIAELLGDNEKMVLDVYSHIIESKEKTMVAINNIFS